MSSDEATDGDVWFTLCVGDERITITDEGATAEDKEQFETFINSHPDAEVHD